MNFLEYLTHLFEDEIDLVKKKIEVHSIKNGSTVADKHTISGTHENGLGTLQGLVYANDGKWYPQEPAKITGNNWSINAVFGSGMKDVHHQYYLFALIATDSPITEPVDKLPANIERSKIFAVRKQI